MTVEQIDRFMERAPVSRVDPIKIFFKTRSTVEGVFIRTDDFEELRKKNFWRIVTVKSLDTYSNSKDIGLSRIYNGAEFTKLSEK